MLNRFHYTPGVVYPTNSQLDRMADEYAALEPHYGDDPNTIADVLGWTRGTACALRLRNRLRAVP